MLICSCVHIIISTHNNPWMRSPGATIRGKCLPAARHYARIDRGHAVRSRRGPRGPNRPHWSLTTRSAVSDPIGRIDCHNDRRLPF